MRGASEYKQKMMIPDLPLVRLSFGIGNHTFYDGRGGDRPLSKSVNEFLVEMTCFRKARHKKSTGVYPVPSRYPYDKAISGLGFRRTSAGAPERDRSSPFPDPPHR